ncbi:MAG: PAS domain-containing sensor histidine kinase, partial [Limisphaerales bacterium]
FRFLHSSDAFCAITRYRPEEVIGQQLNMLYGSKTEAGVAGAAIQAMARGRRFHGELLCYRADGTTCWCSLILAPASFPDRSRGQVAGALIDISERHEREDRLRELEANARSIFENAVEGVYRSTPEGGYLAVNRALAKMYGYRTPEELLKGIKDIQQQIYLNPAMREQFKAEIERADQVHGLEYQVRRRDGRAIWISESARVARDANGRIRYYEGFVQDISRRKEAEAALLLSQQKLVEVSRQIGVAEMATGILHNLGNALNSVGVSAATLSEALTRSKVSTVQKVSALINAHFDDLAHFLTVDHKGRQIPKLLADLAEHLVREQKAMQAEVTTLKKSVEHACGIVAMQQDYAKNSKVTESVTASLLMEEALQLTASSLARHKIELVREFGLDLPLLTVPKHKVLQILINLIRNSQSACNAAHSGSKRLTLRTKAGHGEHRVRFEIEDNGIGMPPETLARLFSHGFTTRKDGHGFGLHSGASLSKELGGSLTAYSQGIGKGAVFILELPCGRLGGPH